MRCACTDPRGRAAVHAPHQSDSGAEPALERDQTDHRGGAPLGPVDRALRSLRGPPGVVMIHANNNLRDDGEADDARLGGEALPEPRAGLVNDLAAVVGRLRRHVPVIRKMAVKRLEVEHHVHLRRRA